MYVRLSEDGDGRLGIVEDLIPSTRTIKNIISTEVLHELLTFNDNRDP